MRPSSSRRGRAVVTATPTHHRFPSSGSDADGSSGPPSHPLGRSCPVPPSSSRTPCRPLHAPSRSSGAVASSSSTSARSAHGMREVKLDPESEGGRQRGEASASGTGTSDDYPSVDGQASHLGSFFGPTLYIDNLSRKATGRQLWHALSAFGPMCAPQPCLASVSLTADVFDAFTAFRSALSTCERREEPPASLSAFPTARPRLARSRPSTAVSTTLSSPSFDGASSRQVSRGRRDRQRPQFTTWSARGFERTA